MNDKCSHGISFDKECLHCDKLLLETTIHDLEESLERARVSLAETNVRIAATPAQEAKP